MSDSLKQAVEAMEVAWRRLREVLDGAALVVRPMTTAPRDGTEVMLHRTLRPPIKLRYAEGQWIMGALHFGSLRYQESEFIGWSPVK